MCFENDFENVAQKVVMVEFLLEFSKFQRRCLTLH